MMEHASCELGMHEIVKCRKKKGGEFADTPPHTLVDCAGSQINTPTHRCRRMESQMAMHEMVNGALDRVYIGIFV